MLSESSGLCTRDSPNFKDSLGSRPEVAFPLCGPPRFEQLNNWTVVSSPIRCSGLATQTFWSSGRSYSTRSRGRCAGNGLRPRFSGAAKSASGDSVSGSSGSLPDVFRMLGFARRGEAVGSADRLGDGAADRQHDGAAGDGFRLRDGKSTVSSSAVVSPSGRFRGQNSLISVAFLGAAKDRNWPRAARCGRHTSAAIFLDHRRQPCVEGCISRAK
ncbi:hypothetical protein AWB81_07215 [Caballeronia arationis]|nr:hypothetical protein AWB81_07215 [Caballeronia arationis]